MPYDHRLINAHGTINDELFIVVPDGHAIAIVGTVGTVLLSSDGYNIDYAAEEFMTWYYPGDIMPYIYFNEVMEYIVNNNHAPIPVGPYIEGDESRTLTQFMENFTGITYVKCCLMNSPPEFTMVQSGKDYVSMYYHRAHEIAGMPSGPKDRLLYTSLYLGSGPEMSNTLTHLTIMVHPDICPELFERIFVNEETVPDIISASWVVKDRYYCLNGYCEDEINEISNAVKAPVSREGLGPYFPELALSTLDEGCGIVITHTSIREATNKNGFLDGGVYMVTERSEPGNLKFPLWGARFIEPVRGGGYAIPDAEWNIRNGKPYTGEIGDIR